MLKFLTIGALLTGTTFGKGYTPSASRDAFDCQMRELLLDYAAFIQADT